MLDLVHEEEIVTQATGMAFEQLLIETKAKGGNNSDAE